MGGASSRDPGSLLPTGRSFIVSMLRNIQLLLALPSFKMFTFSSKDISMATYI